MAQVLDLLPARKQAQPEIQQPQPKKRPITIVRWKRHRSNTLQGFATVRLNHTRMLIHGVMLHTRGSGNQWVVLPQKEVATRNGGARWEPIIEFDDPAVERKFSEAVFKALAVYHGYALE